MDGNEAIAGQPALFPAQRRSGRLRQPHIPNKWGQIGTKEVAVVKSPAYKLSRMRSKPSSHNHRLPDRLSLFQSAHLLNYSFELLSRRIHFLTQHCRLGVQNPIVTLRQRS
jgi:hypothetical protein